MVAPEEVESFRGALLCGAVGAPGARAEIRAWLRVRGWREMEEFCLVA